MLTNIYITFSFIDDFKLKIIKLLLKYTLHKVYKKKKFINNYLFANFK